MYFLITPHIMGQNGGTAACAPSVCHLSCHQQLNPFSGHNESPQARGNNMNSEVEEIRGQWNTAQKWASKRKVTYRWKKQRMINWKEKD